MQFAQEPLLTLAAFLYKKQLKTVKLIEQH